MIGLASEAVHIASAKHYAILWFATLVGLECIATALIAGLLRMQMFESRAVSLISRLVLAVATTVFVTCILVATITWLLRRMS
jgi:hypothetical protein